MPNAFPTYIISLVCFVFAFAEVKGVFFDFAKEIPSFRLNKWDKLRKSTMKKNSKNSFKKKEDLIELHKNSLELFNTQNMFESIENKIKRQQTKLKKSEAPKNKLFDPKKVFSRTKRSEQFSSALVKSSKLFNNRKYNHAFVSKAIKSKPALKRIKREKLDNKEKKLKRRIISFSTASKNNSVSSLSLQSFRHNKLLKPQLKTTAKKNNLKNRLKRGNEYKYVLFDNSDSKIKLRNTNKRANNRSSLKFGSSFGTLDRFNYKQRPNNLLIHSKNISRKNKKANHFNSFFKSFWFNY
jgi:hypothetical protein